MQFGTHFAIILEQYWGKVEAYQKQNKSNVFVLLSLENKLLSLLVCSWELLPPPPEEIQGLKMCRSARYSKCC